MTTEEKAKAYDEAISWIKEQIALGRFNDEQKDMFKGRFPELKESEDERIRNLIYCLIRDRSDNGKLLEANGCSVEKALAWLEKQKEQKPNPVEESLKELDELPESLHKLTELTAMDAIEACMLRYLQSAANRKDDDKIMADTRRYKQELVSLIQNPAEWSDNEKMFQLIEDVIRVYGKTQGSVIGGVDMDTLVVFLRSLHSNNLAEWSEKDERVIQDAIWEIHGWCLKHLDNKCEALADMCGWYKEHPKETE